VSSFGEAREDEGWALLMKRVCDEMLGREGLYAWRRRGKAVSGIFLCSQTMRDGEEGEVKNGGEKRRRAREGERERGCREMEVEG
jgi:hypothetical protein